MAELSTLRTAELADGTRVEIRFIRPEDKDELRRAFLGLSERSRLHRFLGPRGELDDETLRHLTEVDGRDHVAIVAVTDSPDLKTERGLGVARFIRIPGEPEVAEGAVTVAEEAQGKGLGRLLMTTLAERAQDVGIRVLRAEVAASNERIRRLLADAGAVVRKDHGETIELEVALDPVPDTSDAHRMHPLRRLLRALAQALTALHPPELPDTES